MVQQHDKSYPGHNKVKGLTHRLYPCSGAEATSSPTSHNRATLIKITETLRSCKLLSSVTLSMFHGHGFLQTFVQVRRSDCTCSSSSFNRPRASRSTF